MPGVVCIKKTRRLIHVNFFLQCTMEKSILFIELADGPTIGESKCKYNPMVVEKKKGGLRSADSVFLKFYMGCPIAFLSVYWFTPVGYLSYYIYLSYSVNSNFLSLFYYLMKIRIR